MVSQAAVLHPLSSPAQGLPGPLGSFPHSCLLDIVKIPKKSGPLEGTANWVLDGDHQG